MTDTEILKAIYTDLQSVKKEVKADLRGVKWDVEETKKYPFDSGRAP